MASWLGNVGKAVRGGGETEDTARDKDATSVTKPPEQQDPKGDEQPTEKLSQSHLAMWQRGLRVATLPVRVAASVAKVPLRRKFGVARSGRLGTSR
jgi:hypothetical protein